MLVNELFQWAAILICLFLVAGAYRLVAMRPRSGVLTMDQAMGPHLGSPLPRSLTDQLPITNLADSRGYLFAFVTEGCPSCGGLIEQLRRRDQSLPGQPQVIVVVGSSAPAMISRLREENFSDAVVEDSDGRIFGDCHIGATPFLVLTDTVFGAVEKRVSSDASELLSISIDTSLGTSRRE